MLLGIWEFCFGHELNAGWLMAPPEFMPDSRPDDQEAIGVSSGLDVELVGRIDQTIAYMKQHLDEPLQAASLASRASISLSHYFALFKRVTGRTPIDFFISLRMERARDLLESTSLSVKAVAAALGYDDPFYFSRVFKSVNGIAPTDYRAARQGVMLRRGSDPLGCAFEDSGGTRRTAGACGRGRDRDELRLAAVPASG
jgi:AraC-like DNA-binding protein